MKNVLGNFFKKKIGQLYEKYNGRFFLKHNGYCPCCDKQVFFVSRNIWLRDHFKCNNCNCIPRERALILIIEREFPNWKNLNIHESSPGNRGHSPKLKKFGKKYTQTQFFAAEPFGQIINGFRNEDLEKQTFEDDIFDLVVTSDVVEHIYEPDKAFKEIHRTLKPGGAHIFSVPIINKHKPTKRWAKRGPNGEPEFLYTPEWHGNPIDKRGSPVTMHWGYDIIDYIKENTGAECSIEYIDNLDYGIRAEYIEIIIARKLV